MSARVLILAEDTVSAGAIRRALHGAGFDERAGAPPVLVVLDERRPEHAVARIAELRAAHPSAKLVLLAPRLEPEWLAKVTAAGADAVVRKTADSHRTSALVRDIAMGNVFHAFAPPAAPAGNGPLTGLTGRELQILRLMAAGASNSAIAAELWITQQTVKFHLSNVYRKLGVANRTQASRYAHLHGLIDEAQAPLGVPVAA